MRLIKRPKIGEYVLASHWRDCDPNDAWFVGFVESVTDYGDRLTYRLKDSPRQWRHVRRITADEGREWLTRFGT